MANVILGISGSIRPGSNNINLLIATKKVVPADVTIKVADYLADLPLTSLEAVGGVVPEAVKKMQHEIKAADGVLFSTPQYNYNIPVELKKIIEWSQWGEKNIWVGKPVGIIGAAVDTMGTQRAQDHLLQILTDLRAKPFTGKVINILEINKKIDTEGRLSDDEAGEDLRRYLADFVKFIKK